MKDLICPLDGKPCEQSCPDRYTDRLEGGCLLTTLMEQADIVFILKPDNAT